MSLDVYLYGPEREEQCYCSSCGHDHIAKKSDELFSKNITHNLGNMADAAGIYKHLWRPDEIQVTKASELVEPLADGLQKLLADPAHYETFNPENGWGTYEGLVRFVREYLEACRDNPDARVSASR